MITLENVTVDELLSWMNEKVEVDHEEYLEWKAKRLEESKLDLKAILEGTPKRTYIRGSDFRSYLSCARILYYDTHHPKRRQVYINKGIYGAIKKHELIQSRLKKRGWTAEYAPKRYLNKYELDGVGHLDCVSPSMTFFMEMKHNKPSPADELQTAWYQYICDGTPPIALLYRTRLTIIPDLTTFILKYIPRVVGTIIHDVVPPLHPKFPLCKGTCDYASRCGRPNRVQMHQGTPVEWIEYFKKIEAWR